MGVINGVQLQVSKQGGAQIRVPVYKEGGKIEQIQNEKLYFKHRTTRSHRVFVCYN